MADDPKLIDWEVRLSGVEEAVREINKFRASMEKAGEAADEAGDEFKKAGDGAKKAGDGFSSATGESMLATMKIEQLGGVLGNVGSTLARINPEFGRLGSVIGGVGAALPALLGTLGPLSQGLAAVTVALDIGAMAWEAYGTRVETAAQTMDGSLPSIRNARERLQQLSDEMEEVNNEGDILGGLAPAERIQEELSTATGAIERQVSQREGLMRRLSAQVSDPEMAIGFVRNGELVSEQTREVAQAIIDLDAALNENRQREQQLRTALSFASEAESVAGRGQAAIDQAGANNRAQTERDESLRERRRNRRGGTSEAQRLWMEEWQARLDAGEYEHEQRLAREEAYTRMLLAEYRRRAEEELAVQREVDAAIEIERQKELSALDRLKEKRQELVEKQQDALDLAKEQERDALDKLKGDAESVLGPVMQGLTRALSEIIAGSKSADEAFEGLLASFLEMVAQEASLQAAKEFAASIASFASYDYTGGGQHLAAGVAYTAVAVAAGAASIAVAPPSEPASPEANTGGGQGGGTTIIQWNSPVVTAGTRAELGREIGMLVGEGDRRFGRA